MLIKRWVWSVLPSIYVSRATPPPPHPSGSAGRHGQADNNHKPTKRFPYVIQKCIKAPFGNLLLERNPPLVDWFYRANKVLDSTRTCRAAKWDPDRSIGVKVMMGPELLGMAQVLLSMDMFRTSHDKQSFHEWRPCMNWPGEPWTALPTDWMVPVINRPKK